MLNQLTLTQALEKLKNKEIKLSELYDDIYTTVDRLNSQLNVYLTLNPKPNHSTLNTLPIAVKDNFCTQNLRTTASSKVLDNFIPPFESTVTTKLKQAGAFIIGKTNMDAWAHGSSTETSDYGRTLNPNNTDYLPGGSSGGSAAAVAADMCLAAIGSETAGSIRLPASWCGVVGLKPTYGRVSRYGVIAMASSTDSPGPITKTVADAAFLLNIMAGPDKFDATTSPKESPDFTTFLNQKIKGMKVGVVYFDIPGIDELLHYYEPIIKTIESLGGEVEMVKALDPRLAIGVYTIVQRAEVSSNLARFDGIRYGFDRSYFGEEAKRRIMLGTYVLSKGYADKYYHLAQKVRTLFINDFNQLFEKYDVLISPSAPGFAQKVGATEDSFMYGELTDLLAEPSSVAGLPAISIPCYHDQKTNLDLGLNIMANKWREDQVIKLADALEKATPWNRWRNHV